MEKKMLSLKEVSEVYSIPKWTLYKMSSRGMIPIIKIGARVYVDVADFDSWRKKQKRNKSPEANRNDY